MDTRTQAKPEPLSADEEEILNLLLELSPPDPEEHSPLFYDLIAWAQQNLDDEERDEQPSPPVMVDILKAIEDHYQR